MKQKLPYPTIAVTVDCVVFGYSTQGMKLLLIKRGIAPFMNSWALPGGFVLQNETLEDAAKRELKEEAGIENVFLEQLFTFGDIARDPRGRTISITYYALVNFNEFEKLSASTDASDAKWFNLNKLPKQLAFDHLQITQAAINRLKAKITYQPIIFELLPEKFVFSELENIYQSILETEIDRRNFRKKMLATGLVKQTKETLQGTAFRPPKLFVFDRKKYLTNQSNPFDFKF